MQGLHDELIIHISNALVAADLLRLKPQLPDLIEATAQKIIEDLAAFASRDPATQGRLELILQNRCSFKAVMYYRLAHWIWHLPPRAGHDYRLIAERLSLQGKLISGAHIHPAAQIGRRFVLEHGYGTIIGPTCRIGDDCHLLCAVILDTQLAADDPEVRRHPRLGNNVEVGAGARLIGYVIVDDNVLVSPACVITHTLPTDTWLKIVSSTESQ
ncbi:serine acetyltransferase [Pseudomonas idahonensis]|uniref:serine O-acetyltransferase n=1 Tax=Pseudomonas idahonensis TaxID=2942628 RepID=UPI0030D58C4D